MIDKNLKKSIDAINSSGALLVFPVKNAKEPASIWSKLYPRTKMVWAWDDSASDKVGSTWLLMKKLSDCRKVIYSKWYQDRATFFSIELFQALIKKQSEMEVQQKPLSPEARQILEILEMDSPLSTKEIKAISELQGKMYAGIYNRAMRELFQRFLIVGYGEVDDGAFPSAAIGATKTLYEEIYFKALEMDPKEADKIIRSKLEPKFLQFYQRSLKKLSAD